ncbi:MAG: hypothetical protein WDO12_15255 [Pseudomonadota bacterium]
MNRNRAAYGAIAASLLVLLAACSSKGSVNIGKSQGVDPGTVDFPIVYVKHYFDDVTLPDFDKLNNPGRTRLAVGDADLFLRSSASPGATEINITGSMTADGNYDIKDVDVSPDAKNVIFAMRGPIAKNANERKPPFWTLWEYTVATGDLHQVIDTTLFPVGGNDVSPHYLPDGSIVFSSTRQRGGRAVLLDENKPGYEAQFQGAGESAFLLHVLSPDRQNIEQITYNLGHDLWPETLRDTTALADNPQGTPLIPRQGRIVFSRWDSSGGGMSLYTVNADGSGLNLLYGARSHAAGIDGNDVQFTHPHEMADGRILALMRPFDEDTDEGGDLLVIDTDEYVENTQAMAASASLAGPAQKRITPNQVKTIEGPSPGGRFRSAYPLWDGSGRILVSWSLCRVQDTTAATPVPTACTTAHLADPNYEPAPPLYSGFVFNPADNTFKPLFTPEENVMVSDIVAVQARTQLWVKAAAVARPLLADQGVGVLSIRSVYDFDGAQAHTAGTNSATCTATRSIANLADPTLCTAANRTARFIRIEEAVPRFDRQLDMSLPDIDFNASVGSGVGFMRTILGYAPVEPDGSVSVRVPANLPFTFSILDSNGRRLPQFGQHASWLQLRPGEERHCNGCHEKPAGTTAVEKSHGRDGTSVSAWNGAISTTFPNTIPAATVTAQAGDTMALARARATCVGSSGNCSEVPRVNLLDVDFWNTPVTTPATDPAVLVSLRYNDGVPLAPTSLGCQSNWTNTCRIVINYETHIHLLWSKLRQELDPNDNTIVTADHTCINCHSSANAMGNPQVPAGQLDLTDGDRDQTTQHKNAYTELVTGGQQQQIDAVTGQLTFVTVLVDSGTVDPVTGQPILIPQQVPESRRLTPLSARGSTRFFCNNGNGNPCVERFGPQGSHAGYLTPGELRLISEWTDIGAQYYNNQFDPDAPKN